MGDTPRDEIEPLEPDEDGALVDVEPLEPDDDVSVAGAAPSSGSKDSAKKATAKKDGKKPAATKDGNKKAPTKKKSSSSSSSKQKAAATAAAATGAAASGVATMERTSDADGSSIDDGDVDRAASRASDVNDDSADVNPDFDPTDRTLFWFIAGVTLVGLALRLFVLGDRAMHHDESLDAWWSWNYLNGNFTGYDPVYHGPLRFYITAGFYGLFGTTEFAARLFSALSGTLLIATPWFIRRQIGNVAAGAAAVALCLSPTMLYFSRFGREDAQIAFLTGAMIVLACMYMRRPTAWIPSAFMFLLACSFAIKESTYIWIVIVGGYFLVVLAVQAHRVRRGLQHSDDDDPEPRATPAVSSTILLAITGIAMAASALSWRFVGNAYVSLLLLSIAMAAVVVLTNFDFERVWPVGALFLMIVTVVIGANLGIAFYLIALYGLGLLVVAVAKARQAVSSGAAAVDIPILARFADIGVMPWVIAVGILVFFFEAFFTGWFYQHPEKWTAGVTDAVRYWDSQQEVNRGGQPWYYYLVATPVYEWLFIGLAAIGTWRALKKPTFTMGFLVWTSAASLILYSYAGERMPWLIVHPLLPVLFLAGVGFHWLWKDRSALSPLLLGLVAFGLVWTSFVSIRASFTTDTDARELLVQAGQATEHVEEVLAEVRALDAVARAELGRPAKIAVTTDNSWPWAWYFRDSEAAFFNPKDGINLETGILGLPSNIGELDIVLQDWLATNDAGETQWFDPATGAPGFQARSYAMRSWWVPAYAPGGGTSVSYADASPVDWLKYSFLLDAWPDSNDNVGCGSVDQYMLVSNELANAAARSAGMVPTATFEPLSCASDTMEAARSN